MRRALSISLILLLWLPALAALAPGLGEARLPFCCRRQGAHHCAMDAATVQSTTSGPMLSAPSRCPQFPGALPATISPHFVAAALPAQWPALVSSIASRPSGREAARAGLLRTQVDRGPPASSLA